MRRVLTLAPQPIVSRRSRKGTAKAAWRRRLDMGDAPSVHQGRARGPQASHVRLQSDGPQATKMADAYRSVSQIGCGRLRGGAGVDHRRGRAQPVPHCKGREASSRCSVKARRYLRHPVLGNRLRDDLRLVLSHTGNSSLGIFGTPDDLKFRSCLTLFREAAEDQNDRSLFSQALDQFYGGKPDPRTLQLLRSG
jgi:hypothetical protein